MSDAPEPRPGFRVHPVDLLVLAVAVALACVAYAYLFRRTPIPLPVDRFLGTVLVVEFPADRPWKRDFPGRDAPVMIEDFLSAEVVEISGDDARPGGVRVLTLRVVRKMGQGPGTITTFRTGIHRGARVRISQHHSEVTGEIVEVQEPGSGK